MSDLNIYKTGIFRITDDASFERHALWAFQYQAQHNEVYKKYLEALRIKPERVSAIAEIPFLPIQFFKTHTVTDRFPAEEVFTSSGTTGAVTSSHYVAETALYEASYTKAFGMFYGDIGYYTLLALLPSYLEREGSSLIYMADDLIKRSGSAHSGFYLHDHAALHDKLQFLESEKKPAVLLGVSYALLDFADTYQMDLKHTIVMETGGMKGQRKEMVREELHRYLCERLGVDEIHSEYGMTELLSQAYSHGNGIYECPPWMKVLVREPNDPFALHKRSAAGGVNIIDLANIHSCSFLATQDLGRVYDNGTFEILGRFDNSDIRGCNLLVV